MIIVHITSLSNNKASGISVIVPLYIKWQSKHADVFWYNLNTTYIPPENCKELYHSVRDYPYNSIAKLPQPFCAPDLVVFHGIFFYGYCQIANMLNKIGVPYIVVPHGSLTKSSIKLKAPKKHFGFLFLFGKFLRNARAIQYLTEGEQIASRNRWNENYIVVPNGCEIPQKQKKRFRERDLVGVFVGRKSIFHKGLDILVGACNIIKEQLDNKKVTIHIYGPDEDGSNVLLKKIIKKYRLENIISLHDGVFGDKKVDVLMGSDFFILTSRFEGHPIAIIEALSYGIPCLVTTGTNMADEIEKYNAGWTADIDVDSVAVALTKVVNATNKLSVIGSNAHELSLNYEWGKVAQNSINKYGIILTKIF